MLRKDLQAIPGYVAGKKFPGAVKLSSNEMSTPPLPGVVEALRTVEPNRYPDIASTELVDALAAEFGHPVTVGCGSSALCQQLVQVTCYDHTDEVIFPWRSFEAYPIFVDVVGATKVAVPLENEEVPLDTMAAAVTDNTRLIFVCNPNNPSGTAHTLEEITAFCEKIPSDVVIAIDEAYIEFADVDTAVPLLDRFENVVILRTFSKAYGLAGLRVGYAIATQDIIEALGKVSIPFAVSGYAQQAALASLRASDELADRVRETREQVARVVQATKCVPSQANFVWFPGHTLDLTAHGVVVRNFPEGTRITVTIAEETDTLLAALEAEGLTR